MVDEVYITGRWATVTVDLAAFTAASSIIWEKSRRNLEVMTTGTQEEQASFDRLSGPTNLLITIDAEPPTSWSVILFEPEGIYGDAALWLGDKPENGRRRHLLLRRQATQKLAIATLKDDLNMDPHDPRVKARVFGILAEIERQALNR